MIRVTVPRPAAEALMPRECDNRYCADGIIRREDGRGVGYCQVCHGSGVMPPVLRLLVVDDAAAIVRAIEAGERIGIDVDCDDSEHHRHLTDGRWHDDCAKCKRRRVAGGTGCDCTDVRVPVGSVRPVRVLPVVGYMRGRVPDAPCIEVVTASYVREWYECPPDATHDRIMHRMVDLPVYVPAESLVGKFAIEVEDARWQP